MFLDNYSIGLFLFAVSMVATPGPANMILLNAYLYCLRIDLTRSLTANYLAIYKMNNFQLIFTLISFFVA